MDVRRASKVIYVKATKPQDVISKIAEVICNMKRRQLHVPGDTSGADSVVSRGKPEMLNVIQSQGVN